MRTYYVGYDNSYYLVHHGIKGQKWGIRRFQNPDGSLTDAGKKRSAVGPLGKLKSKRDAKKQYKAYEKSVRKEAEKKIHAEYKKAYDYADKHGLDYDDYVPSNERSTYLKRAKREGISDTIAKHVVAYSKLVDSAEKKETEYRSEANGLVNEYRDKNV